MKNVFQNHTVICGWNRRGKAVVHALRALKKTALIVIHDHIDMVIDDVGSIPNLFVIAGDPTLSTVLESADIPSAQSVLVLAPEGIDSADAKSVKVALAVERMQTNVYTVVELREIQNKTYFSWTKVDDLITDQEVAVRLLAQGIRHACQGTYESENTCGEESLLEVYQNLLDPHESGPQLMRVDAPWNTFQHMTFSQILSTGIRLGLLPVALVGYRKHEIHTHANGNSNWFSWKTETTSNPAPQRKLRELWPVWPESIAPLSSAPLGIIVIATSPQLGQNLIELLSTTTENHPVT